MTNYRSTFWLNSKHAKWVSAMKKNRPIKHAILVRWKSHQRRSPVWFFQAVFGVARWWEVSRYPFYKCYSCGGQESIGHRCSRE